MHNIIFAAREQLFSSSKESTAYSPLAATGIGCSAEKKTRSFLSREIEKHNFEEEEEE